MKNVLFILIAVAGFAACSGPTNNSKVAVDSSATADEVMPVTDEDNSTPDSSEIKPLAALPLHGGGRDTASAKIFKGGKKADSTARQPVAKGLKDLYKSFFPIGAAITPERDLANPQLVNFLLQHYSSLTPKQALQPMRIHPSEDKYDFTNGDLLVDFAQKNNLLVRGHCLMYYKHMPKWFFMDGANLASRDLLLKRMKDHITAVMSHYKGKVYAYDVVNEATSEVKGDELFRSDGDLFYKIIGPDYVAKAFEFAHEADPTAKLYYNDHFVRERIQKIYALIRDLKTKYNAPIDGVGIQFHTNVVTSDRDLAALQGYLDYFKSLGLKVQITEFDVSIFGSNNKDAVASQNDDYTPGIEAKQFQIYRDAFNVFRKNRDEITSVTFWEAEDGSSNALTELLKKRNYPSLFDKDLKPKKAFFGVADFKQ